MVDGTRLDALIVGAGFAGLYMLHKLRGMGFAARAVDAATGVGGTWYWNRYPGARCDVESMFYCYQFDDELSQEWEWTERYPAQPEILRYANHVADRFDLWPDIRLNTRVVSAVYDESAAGWRIETDTGETLLASYCIMATGCLSAANRPDFPGLDDFEGRVFHTGHWPHEPVDFTGRRVGVIGTGSSAVQAIPEIAKQAAHVTVFQRTATYVIPANNRPLDAVEQQDIKARYPELRAAARKTFGGFAVPTGRESALSVSEEECRETLGRAWNQGGIGFLNSYIDFGIDEEANIRAQEFVRDKIREIVDDPETAEKLLPRHTIGCKRLSLGDDYYATYNRPNVELVPLGHEGIGRIAADGLTAAGEEFRFDDLVLATGFDALTGALARIDIRGRNGLPLRKAWEAGPRMYLGLMSSGFPNLFAITGPGSPSVLSNMMPTIEHHVEWIAGCIGFLRQAGIREIEPHLEAQDSWVEHGNEVASRTLRYTCSSWYLGANVPGKPRVFMPYIGGMPSYMEKCAAVAAAGYEGFELTPA